jgi:serine/threonine-protein kinase
MFAPGTLIDGRFRLERKLGQGANGVVYRARQVASGQEFALKLMLPEAAGSFEARARFAAEGELARSLRHRAIAEVLGAGVHLEATGATPYTVMAPLVGEPLDIVLLRLGSLTAGLALAIVRDVASALVELHARGVTHRALKPAVVFVHRPFVGALVPKLLDFGGVHGARELAPPDADDFERRSGEPALRPPSVGAPAYMSPEQRSFDGRVDARADVWALGVILYRALCGSLPFAAGGSLSAGTRAVCELPHTPLAERVPGLPAGVSALVDRCLAKRASDRLPSARALVHELDQLIALRAPAPPDLARLCALAAFRRDVARDDDRQASEPDPDTIAAALLRAVETWDDEPLIRLSAAAE